MLFVGSCFAESMGKRFQEEKFRAEVNPFGVMYNPASVLHTVERYRGEALERRYSHWVPTAYIDLRRPERL